MVNVFIRHDFTASHGDAEYYRKEGDLIRSQKVSSCSNLTVLYNSHPQHINLHLHG